MNNARMTTGKVRLIFTALDEPRENKNGKEKYSCRFVIDKNDTETLDKINAAIEAAYEDGETKLRGKGKSVPALSAISTPLHDGDLERPDDPNCENALYMNASSDFAPQCYDLELNEIDPTELYSGCYARVCITFFAYNVTGGRGIACGLNSLQFIADGERLAGKADPKADFA